MSDELKPGEIGVLQNLTFLPFMNGMIAEVIGGLQVRNTYRKRRDLSENILCYRCSVPGTACFGVTVNSKKGIWHVQPHQIRRLSDPDAFQSTEEQKELTV